MRKFLKQRYRHKIVCWNVRTLLKCENTNCSEHRTALVTKELQCLNIDIVAPSETHLSDEDRLSEVSSGFTASRFGKPKGDKPDSGVEFAIQTSLVNMEKLSDINDRIMKLCVPLSDPTLVAIEEKH